MARSPYRIARQEHVGDALDDLQARGRLAWRWAYANRRAIYNVRQDGQPERSLDTRSAEQLVSAEYQALAIPWRPVPHPGGEDQRGPVLEWIAQELQKPVDSN
jgi:hypothetical protein